MALNSRLRGLFWLGAAMLIGIAIRAWFINQPMRYDEAYTFLIYANRSWLDVFRYTLPNNHVLHSLLVKLVAFVSSDPAALRMPAFMAGVCAIPLAYAVCKNMGNGRSGIFAAFIMAAHPYLILYSTNARGYTLMIVFALLLTLAALWYYRSPSFAKNTLMAALAALGMLTMPSILFVVTGVYLWLALLCWTKHRSAKTVLLNFILPCGILSALFTLVLYAPVLYATKSIAAITANEFVRPLPYAEFLRLMPLQLQFTFNDFTRDLPIPFLLFWLALLLMGFWRAIKLRNAANALLLPSILLGSFIVLMAQHATPFPRTWIYLIPFAIIAADGGFVWLMERWSGAKFALVAATGAACALFAVMLARADAIPNYPDTGTFAQAPVIAAELAKHMKPTDKLTAKTPEDWPVYFYLWQSKSGLGYQNANAAGSEFFVTTAQHPISQLTNKPAEQIFEYQGAAIFRAKQP